MLESEVLIVEIPNNEYDTLIENIVKYSIISLPFTIDRMNQIERYGIVEGNKKRISNIFKGKLAESLFQFFCESNNINVDFESCETPFYQIDKRDFLFNGKEYDLKNNFIYHDQDIYTNYTKLPALIPNRYDGDQWSSRLTPYHSGLDVGYIFSFIKGADLQNNQRGKEFFDLSITEKQGTFIHNLYKQYEGLPQNNIPFNEEWFWNEMAERGDLNFFKLNSRPKLIITGVGNADNWINFKDTGPFSQNNYKDNPILGWYKKVGMRNSLKFLNGEIWGTITNKTCPIQMLTSITSVFDALNGNIKYGRFKDQA